MVQQLHQSTSRHFPRACGACRAALLERPPKGTGLLSPLLPRSHCCLPRPLLQPRGAGSRVLTGRPSPPGHCRENRARVGWGAGRALWRLRGSPCRWLPPSTRGMRGREKPTQPPQAACSEDQCRRPPQLLPRKQAAPGTRGHTFTRGPIPASAAGHEANPPAQRC